MNKDMNEEQITTHIITLARKWQKVLKIMAFIGALICHGNSALAQLEDGKIYNFVNVANNNSSMAISGFDDVSIATTNPSDYVQLWYAIVNEDETYSLRNMSDGRYLRSSNSTSVRWTMVESIDDNCKFHCISTSDGHTLRASNTSDGHHYMHYGAGQGKVVCWSSDAKATHWTIQQKDMLEEEIQNNWKNISEMEQIVEKAESYQQTLDLIFADKACIQLNAEYSSMSDEDLAANENYARLPAILQNMVMKVKHGNWNEANADANKQAWDSEYAQRFRVQLYEPYNEPEAAAKALGINAHTNLNNPTGIYVSGRQLLYIMVEGEIKDGASLYLSTWTGHGKPGKYNEGVELKGGLNIVPQHTANSAMCINYVVHTFDSQKKGADARLRKLSDYEPLKIHIEGGHITGYYNKVGDALWGEGDDAADWDYYATRANQTDLTILGKYITLQFPLNDEDTEGHYGMNYYLTGKDSVKYIIDEWDNVMLWERMLMGLPSKEEYDKANDTYNSPYSDCNEVFSFTGTDTEYPSDYADYYNLHGLSFGVGGNSYMYGSWDHCGYHYNTMESIILNLPREAGVHWGPGHEIGHQHQGPLNMRGLTEVTNNLFSNVVLWFYGETTSRYNGTEGALSNALATYNSEDGDFFSNNIWVQTHMYYKLFLYYHVLGHNTAFYPRLYEMLRRDPMTIEENQDGSKCLLHFYKKCCEASGEDLTEFFRAHGFFKVMKDRFVGDYSNAYYNMTQEQIDSAIEEVKSKGYPVNTAVLFINDATNDTLKSHKGDNLEQYGETTLCAEVGAYSSFAEGEDAGDYTFRLNGNSVTLEGTGGVGFAIYNPDGEIIAFSDKKTFNVNAETAGLLNTGQAVVKILNKDNSEATAKDVFDGNNRTTQHATLGELLDCVKNILDYADETGKKAGYYKPDMINGLAAAYENAKTAYDNKQSADYAATYRALLAEYTALQTNGYAKTGIVKGYAYQVRNRAYGDLSMSINSEDKVICEAIADTDAQKWYFEATDTEGAYYLKNKKSQKYAKGISRSIQLDAGATGTDEAEKYTLRDMGKGVWAITKDLGLHCAQSQDNKVVGWDWQDEGTTASHWYITAIEEDETETARQRLKDLVSQTEILMEKVGEVVMDNVILSTTDEGQFKITDNNGKSEGSLNNLLDGKTDSYYVSNWSNTPTQQPYLQITADKDNTIGAFHFTFTSRNSGNAPTPVTIEVRASSDGTNFELLETFTKTKHNMPEASNNNSNTATMWTSHILGDHTSAYKALRFTVTEAERSSGGVTNSNGVCHFGISEFGIIQPTETLNDTYRTIKAGLLLNTFNKTLEANNIIASGTTASELNGAYEDLYALYETLSNAYNDINDENLNAKKEELKSLKEQTESLITSYGEIVTKTTTIPLQATEPESNYYLHCNAYYTQKQNEDYSTNCANLLDNDVDSYTHTDYSGNNSEDGLDHYLRVYAEEGIGMFTFNYTTRSQNNQGNPQTIVVEGCNEANGTYTEIETISSGLPTGKSENYTSNVIGSEETTYRYIRFRVTKSGGNKDRYGHYYFYLAEFGLTRHEASIEKKNEIYEDIDEELLLSVYNETLMAQSTYEYANSEQIVKKAISKLREKYDALVAAIKYKVNIPSAGAATFYTPVAVKIPDGIVAKYVKAEENTGSTGVLIYTKIASIIPANTAVVLIAKPGNYSLTSAPNETYEEITDNVLFGYANNTIVAKSEHQGTGESGTVYALANKDAGVAFYHFVGKNYTAFKAYLDVISLAVSGIRHFTILDEDTETGIEVPQAKRKQTIHDVSGRRVSNMDNGVYIVNGKKVLR